MAHCLTKFHLPSFSLAEKLKFVSDVWLCGERVENSNICTLSIITKSQQSCQCIHLPHNGVPWKRMTEIRRDAVLMRKYRICLSVEMYRK